MKHNTIINMKMLLSMLLIFLILSGCEYKNPEEHVQNPEASPIINYVEPEDAAGALFIKIIGDNFSKDLDKNFVYFDNGKDHVQALNKSATKTEIIVHRPLLTGDSVRIKVLTQNAEEIAEYFPYRLDAVVADHGRFLSSDVLAEIAMDANENLYVYANISRIVIRITPDGEKADSIYNRGYRSISDMKIGPEGYIYFLRKNQIFKANPTEADLQEFCSLPEDVSSFDFDEDDNIFAGGDRSGIFKVSPDGSTFPSVGQYSDFNIISIRVFEGYVYVAAEYAGTDTTTTPNMGIWKNEIQSGDLGENIPVFDWAQSGDFSESNINAITFSENGDMYVATDNTPNPILIVYLDGSTDPLFPGVLTPPASDLVWGNDNFLYMLCGQTPIYRITTDRQGALYYGRQ